MHIMSTVLHNMIVILLAVCYCLKCFQDFTIPQTQIYIDKIWI